MTPPGTFDRVYAAIRQRLRQGVYRPGDRLEPAVLADELHASVTPVRDALHRLTGQRLVEAPRHDGFRVPIITETRLRHLYAWHLDLLTLAVMRRRANALTGTIALDRPADGSEHERQNALFRAVASVSGNPEHVAALEMLTDRLEALQRLENVFLDELEAETQEIVDAVKASDWPALRRSLVRYHRRRMRIVPQLLDQLNQATNDH